MPLWTTQRQRAIFKSLLEQPHYYAQLQIEMLCANQDNVDFYQWSQYGDMLETVVLMMVIYIAYYLSKSIL